MGSMGATWRVRFRAQHRALETPTPNHDTEDDRSQREGTGLTVAFPSCPTKALYSLIVLMYIFEKGPWNHVQIGHMPTQGA